MENQPQNSEFRINPENFHPWISTEFSSTGPYVLNIQYNNTDNTLYGE